MTEALTDQATKKPPITTIQTVDQFERAYPDGQYNRLLPSVTLVENIQKFSKLTIEIVKIDPDPRNQEVFSLGKFKDDDGVWHDKLAFTKTALDKIAFTMGIHWVSESCGRTDDRSDRDYFEYKVVALVTKSDGKTMELTASKGINVQDAVDETENKMRDALADKNLFTYIKNKKTFLTGDAAEIFIARKCRAREIQVRTHGLALAESGARNRLVREMNIKGWYTKEELQHPFVIPRIDMNVEEVHADPAQRAKSLKQAAAAANMVYGDKPTNDQVSAMQNSETQDADFETVDPDESTDKPFPPITPRESFVDNIKAMDAAQRHGQMLTMIAEQDIKKEGTDQQVRISLGAWEKRGDEGQIKALLWAFDLRPPAEESHDELPV